ncbi:MAG: hypothetical protein J0H44_19685 [Alphaproteobacteria bacterium]|nr:hypothetical protein [Alphaproteobacteria bacterium]
MRFLLNWSIKLSLAGVLYIAATTGSSLKLPETILGFKVPESARQWVNRNADIAAIGEQTTANFKTIADSFNK